VGAVLQFARVSGRSGAAGLAAGVCVPSRFPASAKARRFKVSAFAFQRLSCGLQGPIT